MLATLKHRKTIHLSLFLFVLVIQIVVFVLWFRQNSNENELTESFEKTSKQNLIFTYSNEVTKNYFDAENSFMEYLHDYSPNSLVDYRNSLEKMTLYLDSLNSLVTIDKEFSNNISIKKTKEKEIIKLRKELDSLIKDRVSPLSERGSDIFNLKNYDYKSVLNSIEYDTIRSADSLAKKGFFTRIGNAMAGKYDIQKQKMQISMKMSYGKTEKTGTPEEQMFNIFNSTKTYYQKEFGNLRNTYSSLREIDRELMIINKKILRNSQDIILFYNESVQQSNRDQFEGALINLKNKRCLIIILISSMAISTILLLLYSIYAYIYEKDLATSKTEAEKNLEFKNRIIGMLSHEMRSPLNIISNITNKMKASKKEDPQSDEVNLLHFTSNSLQITVNQILDFFKNENGKLVAYHSKVNLQIEIISILASLKSLADVKKIALISHVDSSLKAEVWADKGKIHQLFYNIIGNALKFTNQGNITVTCKFTEIEDKYRFDVKIKDTGVGIPKDDLEKVFDKYYQSKHSKEQISFGAGLGLNLCKEIVELYDGKISVDSELNQGTEIDFYLLLDKTEENQQSDKEKLVSLSENRELKAIVIDDDLMVTTILKKMLLDVKFKVATFQSDITAKEYLQKENVDIILTDLQIANVSGIDFIKEIKTMKNENASKPIIAITGDASINDADLQNIQAQEIIIKPVNKEELFSKLLKVLQENK